MQNHEMIHSKIFSDAQQRAATIVGMLREIQPKQPVRSDDMGALDWGICRSLNFFARAMQLAGFWSDFHGVAGGGRDWISAYVGYTLQSTGVADPQDMKRTADLLLSDRYPSGAWGWCPGYPADMDSTSWSTLFLQANQIEWDKQKTVEILLAHQDQTTGGLRTYYGPEFGIADYLGAGPQDDLSGCCSAHVCVSAAAAQALVACGLDGNHPPLERLVQFIYVTQHSNGYWNAYWYHGKTYATAQCVRALLKIGETPESPLLQRTAAWIEAAQLPDGSWNDGVGGPGRIVDTALAVCIALDLGSPNPDKIEKAIDWLLERQRPDGSWDSLPILQIPAANEHAPWNISEWPETGGSLTQGVCVADHNRYFTSATALQALSAWQRRKI